MDTSAQVFTCIGKNFILNWDDVSRIEFVNKECNIHFKSDPMNPYCISNSEHVRKFQDYISTIVPDILDDRVRAEMMMIAMNRREANTYSSQPEPPPSFNSPKVDITNDMILKSKRENLI